jgi:hypothetical protein
MHGFPSFRSLAAALTACAALGLVACDSNGKARTTGELGVGVDLSGAWQVAITATGVSDECAEVRIGEQEVDTLEIAFDAAARTLTIQLGGDDDALSAPLIGRTAIFTRTAADLGGHVTLTFDSTGSTFRGAGEQTTAETNCTVRFDLRGERLPVPVRVGNEARPASLDVSLTWDSAADLDLLVVEPDGSVVGSGARESAQGGRLDTDGNARCDGSRRSERVSYAEPPASGEYRVLVDTFAMCAAAATEFVVRIDEAGREPRIELRRTTGSIGVPAEVATFRR